MAFHAFPNTQPLVFTIVSVLFFLSSEIVIRVIAGLGPPLYLPVGSDDLILFLINNYLRVDTNYNNLCYFVNPEFVPKENSSVL